MSLLFLDLALVGGGVLLGRWIVRRVRARRDDDAAAAGGAKPRPAPKVDSLAGFPCKLGDVIMRTAERDEAWLAGALVLEEERPVAIVFVAPEAGGDRAILVQAPPLLSITWMSPVHKRELALTADPPHTLEHEGERFERVRRLPVKIVRIGTGAPAIGAQAIAAEYQGTGAHRMLVLAGETETLAWKGVALADGEYDVLPGDGEAADA